MTVDHVDKNRVNNASGNLRWATAAEQNQNRRKQVVGDRSSFNKVGVVLTKDGMSAHFESLTEASQTTGIPVEALSRQASSRGYAITIIKDDDPDLDGETWGKHDVGVMVSTFGRVWHTCMNGGGSKVFPRPNRDGYCHIAVKKKQYHVASLVLETFRGQRPSEAHTPDHKDRNRSNNRLDNLQWADKVEQRRNRTPMKGKTARRRVESRILGSSVWVLHDSTSDAAIHCNVKERRIKGICNPKQYDKSTPSADGHLFTFRWYDDPSQVDFQDEIWLPVIHADWKPGGKYSVIGKGCV